QAGGGVECQVDAAWEAAEAAEADLTDLLSRARCGDADAVPLVRGYLAARPEVWDEADARCRQAEDAWLALAVKRGRIRRRRRCGGTRRDCGSGSRARQSRRWSDCWCGGRCSTP